MIVTGTGSSWTSNIGSLFVGNSGTGTLTISDGGAVSNLNSTIGRFSSGMATVAGAGSIWTNSSFLDVGGNGAGALTVEAGGAVSNTTGSIGQGFGGSGTAIVTGSGSTWTNTNALNIGVFFSSTGTLTIADGGAVVVGGAGAVIVGQNGGSTGTLNIGAAPSATAVAPGTLNAATVTFGAGTGTINFNHTSTNYVFGPVISGSGAVNVLAGTTILTGDSTYTGGTTISGGVLQLGNGGTTGSITGDVVNDGTLGFNRSNTYTFAGAISGGGAVTQAGSGTTILTGANTFSGGLTVEEGVSQAGIAGTAFGTGLLTVDAGATADLANFDTTTGGLAGAGDVTLGSGTLTLDQGMDTVFSGVISDTGGLVKNGDGRLNLTATNTYTGATNINGGRLDVTGSIAASTLTSVNNGATLTGTGVVGNTEINAGGTFAPGNSIGTMTVNGSFTLNPGAVYEVEVNAAGQSDKAIVNGTVNLTGSVLRVLAANGNYAPSTDYTIIENDGTDAVVGTFSSITSSLAFLTPTVIYNGGTGNDVVLTLERALGPGGGPLSLCSVANSSNQCNVALALDQFPTDNALFLAVLNQTAVGARQAFDALSGEIHATVSGTLADDSRYVREAVLGRLMQANVTNGSNMQVAALAAAGPQVASLDANAMALGYGSKSLGDGIPAYEPAPLAFWTRAYGAWGDFNGDGNAATADRDLGGFISGMDADIGGSWRAGLATGASFANVDVDARYSSADVESYHLGGYLGGMASVFALRGGGMWAWNDIDTSRAVVFPGFFERQKANYDADTGQLFGEVAYPTEIAGMAVEPFGGLAYVTIDTGSFRERGGALASLRGVDLDQDVGYSTLGLRAATTMQFGGMQVVPHLSAAWQHAFDDVTPGAALAFASTGIGFGIEGVPLAEDSALIDAGLDFALGENTTAGVSYTGQFGDGVSDNGVKGRFTWLF